MATPTSAFLPRWRPPLSPSSSPPWKNSSTSTLPLSGSRGRDHRAAQLVRHHPGRLVAADPQLTLQLHGRDPRVVGSHEVGGPEPELQRHPRAVHDRPRRHRRLRPAGLALPHAAAALQRPDVAAAAAPTGEPVGPARGEQVLAAGVLVGEPRLEAHDRHGEVGPRHAAKLRPTPDGTNPVCTSHVTTVGADGHAGVPRVVLVSGAVDAHALGRAPLAIAHEHVVGPIRVARHEVRRIRNGRRRSGRRR